MVRIAQNKSFADDIRSLETAGEVKTSSSLRSLTPMLVNGVLRIGGRFRNAPVDYDRKRPMILPYKHPLTRLVMDFYHLKTFHAGQQLLIASVREKYWPLRVRNHARQVVHEYIQCFRCKPSAMEQIMGDLPAERVTPTFPFLNTSVGDLPAERVTPTFPFLNTSVTSSVDQCFIFRRPGNLLRLSATLQYLCAWPSRLSI